MQTLAKRTEQNHLPVAQLIAGCLDDQCSIAGHTAGRNHLPADVMLKAAGSISVHEESAHQPVDATGHFQPTRQFAQKPADGLAQVKTATAALTAPERHHRRRSLRRRDDHSIRVNAFQAPGIRP